MGVRGEGPVRRPAAGRGRGGAVSAPPPESGEQHAERAAWAERTSHVRRRRPYRESAAQMACRRSEGFRT
jgi:hypothetical protein